MKTLNPEYLGWRARCPACSGATPSSPQSVHALLGYFLKDRNSPTPFPGRDMLAIEGLFDWGIARPLEKVIESPDHLRVLLDMPEIYRQSVAVVEPWSHVGTNPHGEPVRASKNIAYILQQVADADTILFPLWQSGVQNPERMANILSAGIATIVQGGNPSVHDARSFDGASAGPRGPARARRPVAAAPFDRQRPEHLHLPRSPAGGGVAHAAAASARCARSAQLTRLPLDPDGRALGVLQRACRTDRRVGETAAGGQGRASRARSAGTSPDFAVARNESVGSRHPPAAALRAS